MPRKPNNSADLNTPRKSDPFRDDTWPEDKIPIVNKYRLSEWKLAVVGLVVSLLIVAAKAVYSYRETIREIMYDTELGTEEVTENGGPMFKYVWVESIRYCDVWLPILCGLLTTYFTGIIVFLDSDVPGVHPPSPFSPSKYKQQSGHSFHSNYAFALLIGVTVTLYMYWKQMVV